ncbi:MAG: hypothetical protein ACW99F_03440 [Candidatus Hodarchaeales archaeon]|jgi:hypothetical protein
MSTKTEGDPPITSTDDTLTITMPKEPDRITFEAEEFMVGSDKLCMFGEWGIDFEKINTLEFIMGEKRDKKFLFKKV